MLSYKQFESIKEFILEKGDTQTYCSMHSDSPHYKIREGFNLYLNPIGQFGQDSEKEILETYDELVLQI